MYLGLYDLQFNIYTKYWHYILLGVYNENVLTKIHLTRVFLSHYPYLNSTKFGNLHVLFNYLWKIISAIIENSKTKTSGTITLGTALGVHEHVSKCRLQQLLPDE